MLSIFFLTIWTYLREISEVVVLGFVVAGIIDAVVNKDAIARYLGGSLVGANLLGATIGIVTPLCCCSAIPTAMALFRAGSRRGPACAFLIATPWFNWYGLTALLIFLGPRAALAIAGAAVLIAIGAGLLIDLLVPAAPDEARAAAGAQAGKVTVSPPASALVAPTLALGCRCGETCCESEPPTAKIGVVDLSDPVGKVRAGLRFAWNSLRELGMWILLGVLLGAAVETFVPERTFTQYLGGASLLGLLAALVVASLFSADSLGSLPWVQSLLSKGLGAGSAMILLVAGVGTNISTLGPVGRIMGRRTAVVYAASVVLLAGVLGFVLNRLR